MPSSTLAAAIVLAVAALAGGIYLWYELRRHGSRARERERGAEPLPLFGTDLLVDRSAPVRPPIQARREAERPSAFDLGPAARERGTDTSPPPVPWPERPRAPERLGETSAVDRPPSRAGATPAPWQGDHRVERFDDAPLPTSHGARLPGRPSAPAPREPAMLDGETIRFAIPDEGTLQFLPGRLEVVAGPDAGREIRFVRTPGEARTEITFGRSEGTPYRHVQLVARTVSRQHAAMTLLDGHWQLENRSATNPVLLNGRSLASGEVAPLLVDGDRIEMGEVIFVFHDR